MKALSIWQPYASLIAVDAKRIETRHWAPPRSVCGQRIAIHASKTKRDLEIVDYGHERFREVLGLSPNDGVPLGAQLPLGAIVAIALLAGGQLMDDDFGSRYSRDELIFGNFAVGRYAWHLSDVHRLEEPIPYRGQQGVFELDASTSARLIALDGQR